MKIYKLIVSGAIFLSGYLGYSNFGGVQEKVMNPVLEILSEESRASSALKDELEKREPEIDSKDLIFKLIETLSPLLIPLLTNRRRKTLDDEVADVALKMGVSPATVRGKLGLGDKRKNQVATTKKRRQSDKKPT